MSKKRLDEMVFKAMALLAAAKGDSGFDQLDETCQRILFFVGDREAAAQALKVSDLLEPAGFGSYPTVQKRVAHLVENGWLNTAANPADARVTLLRLSPKAVHAFNRMSLKLERFAGAMKN